MMPIQFLSYAAILIAIAAMIAKALRYIKAPDHLRWELYPVPHEKGRSDYGGSYLEELDWWTKPRRTDFFNEIKEMAAEIILLKGVYHNNRRVWAFSFPFHFGLYLCIGWLFLLLAGAILNIAGISSNPPVASITRLINYLTIAFGYSGLILSGIGALGLLHWRLSVKEQRRFNSPAEYINLALFVIVVTVTLISHFTLDPAFSNLRSYVHSLIVLSPAPIPGAVFTIEIILISLMIMYIPLTRMSHFVAKYFLYHSVRWNDKPNKRGSKLEKSLLSQLSKKVSWGAPHIKQGKSWIEVVKETRDGQ